MELHMEQLRQIVRRAEKRHGQTQHLSLVQVLEAAALEQHPTSTHRDLHRSLLTLALDPEEDWWKKLSRLASTRPSRRAPSRDRTASVDRFSDVLSATTTSQRTTMTVKTSTDGRRARSAMHVTDKMTATRAPVVVVDTHSYESFRLLSMTFTHWTRYAPAPIQLRCLFRWLDTTLPTADPTALGSTLASLALTKSLDVTSKRMALLLHADATLRTWVLLKVWRAWIQHARADLHRRVTVQHRFYDARHRDARDLLRLWHRYVIAVAPKERTPFAFALQTTHTCCTNSSRARADADAAIAATRRLAQAFRAWKTGTLRQQEAAWRGHQARCRRTLCRWRTLCLLHKARRRRFLQTTVASAFRRCDTLRWVARWRASTATALHTQTIDLRRVQTVRRRRFWRHWKRRRLHATIASVFHAQMASHTKAGALLLWQRFVVQRQARHAKWMAAWACHHRHLQRRTLRRWRETRQHQQRMASLLATALYNHLGRTFGTWRANVHSRI
ncbi:hypothetical protein SPRG_03719 [Saprolegnia parasitica CBS 223.65]|uniref:Sfi1 spindle body domain-containing protein n=1 Tax=Saprolegnia parasitica (strain CBS 223.65) TaxID=695850 RepID=A0A067CM89_SAPPC|nr:hypothetical protein SPRG_03719 [Saprolegnia parasitica CBS 223.65]KDO31799.1 hypothetical protein SPRG_03719 [Saprolegnia parasitica CBS 223.65]|eukprot:XP_012197679.1 hypothetical protein SPRG_03719 [Saprolegnia parasitica CBS 223.65]